MVKVIDEALYRWQKDGWTASRIDNGQYTLTHPKARPVVCGLRTQFQTVGTIQGEMRRALEDGPKPVAAEQAEEPSTRQRRKSRRKPSRGIGTGFQFDNPEPVRRVVTPYRKQPAPVAPSEPARRPLAFENAAWEFASLALRFKGYDDSVIDIMHRRYQTDEQYRSQIIHDYRSTSEDKISNLRKQVEELEATWAAHSA